MWEFTIECIDSKYAVKDSSDYLIGGILAVIQIDLENYINIKLSKII